MLIILVYHARQVESGIAMQNLKPTIDNIKRLYGDDKKKVQRETSELYKKAQISPLAGKLPCVQQYHPSFACCTLIVSSACSHAGCCSIYDTVIWC